MSVIVKVVQYILQITQFADQVKITFIAELTSGISGVLEKLFSVLNEIAISTFTSSSLSALFLNIGLNSNYLKSIIIIMSSSGSSLNNFAVKRSGIFK